MSSDSFRDRSDEDRAYQRWVAPHSPVPAETHTGGLRGDVAEWDEPGMHDEFRRHGGADDEPRADGDGLYLAAAGSLAGAVVGAIGGVWIAVQWLDGSMVSTDGPWVALLAFSAAGGSIAGVALALGALFFRSGPTDR